MFMLLDPSSCTTKSCVHNHVLLNAFHYFVEMAQYLLSLPGVQYILSEKLCQVSAETCFCKQRAAGGVVTIQPFNSYVKTCFHLESKDCQAWKQSGTSVGRGSDTMLM